MIVSNIKGGLCNQLFQISAGYAHAKRCDTFFCIDYKLKHTCIQGHPPTKYRDTLYKNIMTTDQGWTFADRPEDTWNDPKHEYTPIPRKKDLLLNGFFQSEKYFADCKDDQSLLDSSGPLPECVADYLLLEKLLEMKNLPQKRVNCRDS